MKTESWILYSSSANRLPYPLQIVLHSEMQGGQYLCSTLGGKLGFLSAAGWVCIRGLVRASVLTKHISSSSVPDWRWSPHQQRCRTGVGNFPKLVLILFIIIMSLGSTVVHVCQLYVICATPAVGFFFSSWLNKWNVVGKVSSISHEDFFTATVESI